ncbi:MAG: hypothetical protein V3V99_11375 [candidate division Zixibacteria bacterium]
MNDKSEAIRHSKSKSQEEIFAEMHRQLRAFDNTIPAAPERMDPVMRILLQLYAQQLERIDGRLDMVWDVAVNTLIRSMCPESMRWPVPAFTVMKCKTKDPLVQVDIHTKFFYKEKREGGQTFFFSPLKTEKLLDVRIDKVFVRVDDNLVDLSPVSEEEMSSTSRIRTSFPAGAKYQIYIGLDYSGSPVDLTGSTIFLSGIPNVLKQLRWAWWYPGSNFGSFQEDCGFCPGLTSSLESIFAENGSYSDWGGLRNSSELFKSLEDSFIVLPENFASTWELGPADPELVDLAEKDGLRDLDDLEHLYWIRLDLQSGGDKARLQSSFEINFDSFIAVNKNDLTLFKHTGGNRLVEVELPEDLSSILEITSVVDSHGRTYTPRHLITQSSDRFYSPEERNNRLVLWFDFPSELELPPESITVNYSVTAGIEANGIEAGMIEELYENHPGIDSAINIIPVNGAIPAKTEKQIMTEVAARLRNRDRSLSFSGISRWAKTFDPRIVGAECENGIERLNSGVRRCIIAKVTVKKDKFYSEDEIELLKTRLAAFLKSRSPVNTHYRVEIIPG